MEKRLAAAGRVLAGGVTALALLAAQTPAQASSSCFGCNIVDEGRYTTALVGQTVYYGQTAYTVDSFAQGKVYLRTASGGMVWSYPRDLYSPEARSERDGAIGGGILLGLLGLAILANSPSSSSSNRSSSSSSTVSSRTTYRQPEPTYTYTPSAAREDGSLGCIWGDRNYGTC